MPADMNEHGWPIQGWDCAWCGKHFDPPPRGWFPKHQLGPLWFCSDYCKNGRREP